MTDSKAEKVAPRVARVRLRPVDSGEASESVRAGDRTASREVRRQQLIEATITAIAEKGLGSLTLSDVAREAGLAVGTVNFHFATKDQLLTDTLEYLTEEYRACWVQASAGAADDPAARLEAMMMADFDPMVCTRRKIATWHSFYGEAKARPTVKRHCSAREREQLVHLSALCKALIEEGGYGALDPDRVATGLSAMTDGLWLDLLFTPGHIDRANMRRTTRTFLAAFFPRHFSPDDSSSQ